MAINMPPAQFCCPFYGGNSRAISGTFTKTFITLDSVQVRRLLVESATAFSGPQVVGYGSGILDAFAALQALMLLLIMLSQRIPGMTRRVSWRWHICPGLLCI